MAKDLYDQRPFQVFAEQFKATLPPQQWPEGVTSENGQPVVVVPGVGSVPVHDTDWIVGGQQSYSGKQVVSDAVFQQTYVKHTGP